MFKDIQAQYPTYDELTEFYGRPGAKANLTKVRSPYKLKLAWQPERVITRFTCHKLVAEPIQHALEIILREYGQAEIERLKIDYFAGCFNYRKMHGGSKLSVHSWAIAVDWYSQANRYKWRADRAAFARPEYDEFLDAWESTGASSYGREKGLDFMHIQYCRFS